MADEDPFAGSSADPFAQDNNTQEDPGEEEYVPVAGERLDDDEDQREDADDSGEQQDGGLNGFSAFGQAVEEESGEGNVDGDDDASGNKPANQASGYTGFGHFGGNDDDPMAGTMTDQPTNFVSHNSAFGFLQTGFCDEPGEGSDEEGGGGGFGDIVEEDDAEGDDEEEEEEEGGGFDRNDVIIDTYEDGDVEEKPEEEEEPKTYDVWEMAGRRERFFSILEPSLTEDMEQPPFWFRVTVIYHLFYFFMVFVNATLLMAGTQRSDTVDSSLADRIRLIPLAFFIIDLILRVASVTDWSYLIQIFVDACTITASLALLANPDLPVELKFLPPLRALRFFLITRVFIRTETFQDVNLALRTIGESMKSILIFVCLLVIGLLLYATFIFIFERGRFDSGRQQWMRPCKEFQKNCVHEEVSPFQSIPDALWLIVQVMTTVGFGDAIPTTTSGRVVVGVAIISGVFVIAYPAMVLIGNLDQMRRDFFAREEKIELERAYMIDKKRILEMQRQTEEERASAAARAETAAFEATMGGLFGLDGMDPDDAEGLAAKILPPDSRIVVFETTSPPEHSDDFEGKRHTFSFMGIKDREIWETRHNEFLYDPILQILTDPDDDLPIMTTPVYLGQGSYTTIITLIIDDLAAQDEATDAIIADGAADESFAHAQTMYSMEVTLMEPIPGVKMHRRVDIGQINDFSVPLVLELMPPKDQDVVLFAGSVKRDLMKNHLRIIYSTSPVTCGLWQQTVPITSIMLATTPFIQDLREIALNISPSAFWKAKEQKDANDHADKRKNVAYISHRHLVQLVYPIFRKVASVQYSIRNVSAFTSAVARMIILHCRELRKHDIPTDFISCIYAAEEVGDSERIYEVDVDYFRTNDFPMGTTTIEFSEKRPKGEVIVKIGDGPLYDQPLVVDEEAFRRDNLPREVITLTPEETYDGTPIEPDYGDMVFTQPN